ncbi:hypothetical protein [Brevibacillus borstelensis]|uniref:hypothetical protein n=1 Tax=Brevibacillus borstelensis TaxID=45462 RepID=UPI0030C458B0
MKKQTLLSISMLALLVSAAASPLPGIYSIVHAANNAPVPAEAPKMITIEELDKKVVDAAAQAMQQLAEGKPIVLEEVSGQNKDCWVLSAKDGRGEVLIAKNNGEIVSMRVHFKFDEVNAALKATVMSTLKEMDAKRSFNIRQVERIKWEKENIWSFNGEGVNVALEPGTGKLLYANAEYETAQVPASVVQAAQKTLKGLSGGQAVPLAPSATLYKNPQEHIDKLWGLSDKNGKYVVGIGAKTGKPVSIKMLEQISGDNFVFESDIPKVFAKPFYTKEKAIAAASSAVKKHFEIDLTGYNMAVQHDTYTFTKQGKPTVVAQINKKGTFWSFLVTPENGLAN